MRDQLAGHAPARGSVGSLAPPSAIMGTAPSSERDGEDHSVRTINQRLFETSVDLIVVVDRRGTIIRFSPCVQTLMGYRPEELVGQSAAKMLYPDDLDNTRNEMRLARRGQQMRSFDCRYVHKDGQVLTLAWKGVWSEP